ncbi:hypothetical protein Pmani_029048 [Petrolisthes manimaculis]|uniref:Uncharacterized protein n=1 Tax=Petrolisthes manimaculis TaxID=1843537 RepID=A0AAE1P0T9_9EUCA|nr:hypothetical protein Pmani_029048 [Petrolisthes manimaculis]
MILQSTSNHTIDTTQSVSVSPAELPVSPHTENTHPSLEPEVTHPPALSAALNEVPNPFITSDVFTIPEDAHPSDMQEAANSSSIPGEASALVTHDVGNYSSVGDTQLSDVQVITPTPTSASTSQSLPSSLTTSCDDLWLTPLTLGEQRLDPTQPGATQRTYAQPSEASLARPLLPNTRLSVPPLGYERFVSAPTIPGVSVMDEETKAKICKMEKSMENILSKLETKDLEMELLATEVKTAYATIELLQKRVNELELKNKEENIKPDSLPPNNCLLLGDSNTQHVLRSDLGNNCTVRSINMSTFVKLRNWVTHNLTRLPSTCVINCGLYDLLDDLTPEVILDNVGSLISDLKEKYSNMKIYVCTIAPAPVSRENICKIDNYNEHLARWADVNGVTLVNTSPMFKLSTGDIDELCFNTEKDTTPLILNRLGVIRLLDAIDKQCPEFQLCSDWKGLKRKTPVFADYNSNRYLQFKKKNDTQQSHSRQYNTSYPLPLLTTDLSNTAPQPHYTQPSPIYPPLPNQQRGEQAQYLPHPTQSPPSRTERHPQPPPRASHNPQYPSPPISHPPPKTYASVTSTPTDVSHRNWYTPPQPSVSHLGSPQYEANDRNELQKQLQVDHDNSSLRERYIAAKNRVKRLIKDTTADHYRDRLKECKGNTSATWKVIKEIIPTHKKTHHAYNFSNPCDKAEEFNNFFSKVGESTFKRSQEELKIEGEFVVDSPHPDIDINTVFRPQPVDINTVILVVKDLNTTTSVGSDSIGLRFFRDALCVILPFLTCIINTSMVTDCKQKRPIP